MRSRVAVPTTRQYLQQHNKNNDSSSSSAWVRTEFLADGLLGVTLVLGIDQHANGALAARGLGDLVDVLRLDDRLHVVLEDLGKVVLELRAPKVRQDLLPIRRRLVPQHQASTRSAR